MPDEGLWLPNGVERDSGRPLGALDPAVERALTLGRSGAAEDGAAISDMAIARMAAATAARKEAAGARMTEGGGLTMATGRPRDPMFYWEANNLPYKWDTEEGLKKIRTYCNTPDAPVWMGDYSFKPIGEVQVGDEVMGWEHSPSGRTKLVRTPVLATQMRMAPEVVKITMESGRTIRCTPDHQWANPHYSPNRQAKWAPQQYREAKVGRTLRHVVDPTAPLESEKDRLTAAWLAGIFDGEGSGFHFSQSPSHNPDVYEAIERGLDSLGLATTRGPQGIYIRGAGRQTRQEFVDFLNWGQPIRRVTTEIDRLMLRSRFGTVDKVVSIESEGAGWVVSMQTGTGNYTAWGYASRNCRLVVMTHPIIGSAIDIYSTWPLQNLELRSKDEAVTDFFTDLFLDQMDYEEHLIEMGREYWTVGEAVTLGSFNEVLGVWEDDELIDPDEVDVIRSPFHKEPRFEIRLPKTIRDILEKREPKWEYDALIRSYPELVNFLGEEARMPVSNVLMRYMPFRSHSFAPRGLPLLMRAFRGLVQEEMLNAAFDAVAERLYTPLIQVKLGASAQDLGTQSPWIPTGGDIAEFESRLDAALAADFRVLTSHFAADISTVFGREMLPRAEQDFARLDDRHLQVFGISKTLLTGAGKGETYAADALNYELIGQLLGRYQKRLKRHFIERAKVVAEAQGFYDYEVRGGKRYPIMEEIVETDPDGNQRIVERPKLLVPDMNIRVMNLAAEREQRQLVEALHQSGVPISMKTRLTNIPVDLEEERRILKDEQTANAVAAQEARQETYEALRARRLPIPDDLAADFEPKAQASTNGAGANTTPEDQEPLPSIGTDDPAATDALVGDLSDEAGDPESGDGAPTKRLPRNRWMQDMDSRPSQSDERRGQMPSARGARLATEAGVQEPMDPLQVDAAAYTTDEAGNVVINAEAGGLQFGPRHIGRRLVLDPDRPLDEQVAEAWGKGA
jgi:hypothetical protein